MPPKTRGQQKVNMDGESEQSGANVASGANVQQASCKHRSISEYVPDLSDLSFQKERDETHARECARRDQQFKVLTYQVQMDIELTRQESTYTEQGSTCVLLQQFQFSYNYI